MVTGARDSQSKDGNYGTLGYRVGGQGRLRILVKTCGR